MGNSVAAGSGVATGRGVATGKGVDVGSSVAAAAAVGVGRSVAAGRGLAVGSGVVVGKLAGKVIGSAKPPSVQAVSRTSRDRANARIDERIILIGHPQLPA